MTKKFISAGAGSGKTYRVTTDVAKMVENYTKGLKENALRPDQVIMTTYTKAAAQELREKAKKELKKLGLLQEALQMEHALIGTVHSVANTFLTKYWYLLGITPDAAAMDEKELQFYRDHSLRGLLQDSDRRFLFRYAKDYNITYGHNEHKSGINYEFWKKDLCQVLDFMQWYAIDEAQLQKSIDTTESFIKCLEVQKEESLQTFLTDGFYDEVEAFFGLKNKLNDNQQNAKNFYYSLRELKTVSPETCQQFFDYLQLKITSQKVQYKLTGPATEKLTNYIVGVNTFTPKSADDQRQYARIIFRLASRWQKDYRQYKDENHLIDFNDMEEMFLKLLGEPEVQQDIQSRFTHLFVDEFQDSNPMQVLIFQQLSSLLNTVYVGDKKQAIYGFRGSDTDLTEAVADSIHDKEPLRHSYRSIESLVNFSNKIFSQVFSSLKKEEVELEMPAEHGNYNQIKRPIRLWPYTKDDALALQIQQLILREGINARDIAVLARSNDKLDKLADELRKLKVPVCRESNDIKESRTGRLMKALLTLVNNPTNQLARAEVAYLAEPGITTLKVIEDRLDHLASKKPSTDYLMDISLLQRLDQLLHYRSDDSQQHSSNLLAYQSISSLVESLVIELDLYALVQNWENAQAEETNLQVLIDLAHKYEDYSAKMALPATVIGFVSFFTNQKQEGAANDKGVRLYTYHKSKGLEWKVVIMLSLDDDAADTADIATKSMLGCHYHRETKPTVDNTNPPMTISLVRNIYGGTDAAKAAVTSRLQQHPLWHEISQQQIDEAARLLYVGVTRARDILILAPKTMKEGGYDFNWFHSVGAKNLPNFTVELLDTENLLPWIEPIPNKTHDIAAPYSALGNNLYVTPSKAGKTPHDINPINKTEHRMHADSKGNDALMGDFIHQVFCCCDDGITEKQIIRLRNSYGLTDKNIPEPGRLLASWKYLTDTLENLFGKAVKRHHERPFRHLDAGGHIVSGYIDLIWETEDAYIVVDYKTCPGNYGQVFDSTKELYAGCHGDQLDCYQRALEAEGKKKVKARIIYYPVTRFIVEVK